MNKKLIIIILAVVLVAGGVGAFLFLKPKKEAPIVLTYYSPGEFFVTNVDESYRLLKAAVVLVLNTDQHEEMLTKENPRIRDTIIFILREQKEEDISNNLAAERLKEEIKSQLNERLGIDNIVEVLFNDYVMQ